MKSNNPKAIISYHDLQIISASLELGRGVAEDAGEREHENDLKRVKNKIDDMIEAIRIMEKKHDN